MVKAVDDLENELQNIAKLGNKFTHEIPHKDKADNVASMKESSSPKKPELEQSKVTLLNQLIDNELEVLKKQYNDRFEKLEKALKNGSINPSSDYEKFLAK